MYDIKDSNVYQESNDFVRCDCIGDRSYFKQVQYESMFQLKAIHIPIENIIK